MNLKEIVVKLWLFELDKNWMNRIDLKWKFVKIYMMWWIWYIKKYLWWIILNVYRITLKKNCGIIIRILSEKQIKIKFKFLFKIEKCYA